jgi:hypothetical protein
MVGGIRIALASYKMVEGEGKMPTPKIVQGKIPTFQFSKREK